LEVFDADRYVVLTGRVFGSYETIPPQQHTEEAFRDIQRKYLPERSEPVASDTVDGSFDPSKIAGTSTGVGAHDIYRTVEEYAKGGSPEAKRALDGWQSPASSSRGFTSPSEKDLSLVSDLAFWCRDDARLIDKCFRQSNRMRAKWDEVHYSDGRSYGDGTIQTAIQSNYDIFSGNYVTE
jgi:putative DNA primase/helicase